MMITRKFRAGPLCVVLCLLLPMPLGAAVVNLTNDTIAGHLQSTLTSGSTTIVGGIINGALFRRPIDSDETGAGSGVFRDLYRVDNNNGAESGYNRPGVMDSAVPNGFDPYLRVGDLVTDSSGSAYVFVVDTNEPGNQTNKYISLDDFKIYIGDATNPDPLPQTLGELGDELGLPVYDMNQSGQDNHALLDYSLHSGSGEMDMFIFVPVSHFAGASADDYVYIYSEFGSYTGAPGFDPAAGPEQVSLPGKAISGEVDPLIPYLPEPGVAALVLLSGMLGLRRRR